MKKEFDGIKASQMTELEKLQQQVEQMGQENNGLKSKLINRDLQELLQQKNVNQICFH